MDKIVNVITPATEVTNVEARAAGATSAAGRPDPISMRCQDRAAADPVDPADTAHQGRQDDQHRGRDLRGAGGRVAVAGGPGRGQPDAERQQDRG